MNRAILWFRRDLRLTDNPALRAALTECDRVWPLYIHAPDEEDPWPPGGASRWWLHYSLVSLDKALRQRSSRLLIRRGPSLQALLRFVREEKITHLYWNRLYDPALHSRDDTIRQHLQTTGLHCHSFNAALLFEPWEVANRNGGPFRVFTPFWRTCLRRLGDLAPPLSAPRRLPPLPGRRQSLDIDTLGLLPRVPWDAGLHRCWKPGETGALKRLRNFLEDGLDDYAATRDRPGAIGTSRLSPHLHFGELGPRQILHVLLARSRGDPVPPPDRGPGRFLTELGWREFAHHLIFHYPGTQQEPLDPRFIRFPWVRTDHHAAALRIWQRGETGIPIVDAGMRELWQSGWMHNRVRMIVASLLTKNLGIHWLEGARWFWDTLVDADLADNSLGWQWTAGCGADAAPFFRIFNPLRQGERFDPEGSYVRRWVPELAGLPAPQIHAPWKAKKELLSQAGIRLGIDYPLPILDLQHSREQALERWRHIR